MSNLIEGKDFYFDDHGFMVLTADYHLNKGYCCGHGCRHCPYDYESVPEPKRSQLLAQAAEAAALAGNATKQAGQSGMHQEPLP